MRRMSLALIAALALAPAAHAAPPGYAEAQADFDGALNVKLRQIMQLWLIAGGYTNAVPTEHFTIRTFKAVQQFEAENGYAPSGRRALSPITGWVGECRRRAGSCRRTRPIE